ncbi:MAG: hypothetical protein K2Q14_02415 [Gammaproteobacteria bacterium]|nr:hypothetical protein [Gammaproteobacteria bacterium]
MLPFTLLTLTGQIYSYNWLRLKLPIRACDTHNKGLYVFGAIITVILGIILVLSHNTWVPNWTVLVTIFCWITLIAGILRLFFAEELRAKAARMLSHPKIWMFGIAPLILAVIFLYLGFCPPSY